MQVFRIKPNTAYGGGCALVCATSVNEAIQEFCKESYNQFCYEEYNCTCNIINNLDYDTTVPHVMFNDIYIE